MVLGDLWLYNGGTRWYICDIRLYLDGIKLCNGGMRWYNGVLCFKLEVLIDKRVVFGGIKLY